MNPENKKYYNQQPAPPPDTSVEDTVATNMNADTDKFPVITPDVLQHYGYPTTQTPGYYESSKDKSTTPALFTALASVGTVAAGLNIGMVANPEATGRAIETITEGLQNPLVTNLGGAGLALAAGAYGYSKLKKMNNNRRQRKRAIRVANAKSQYPQQSINTRNYHA